jgi:tape measure domain-containing protein
VADQTVTLRLQVRADGSVAAVEQVRQATRNLGNDAERAGQRAAEGFRTSERSAKSLGDQVRTARNLVLGFFGIQLGGRAVAQVAGLADEYTNLRSKLRLVTDSQVEANAVGEQVFAIAQRTRAELGATGQLFSRLARATADLNLSQREQLQITETINQAFVVSGATAQEATNAIIQLSQGLAAGALRGEEFNSVAEQAPILMDLLSSALGKSRGELRAFAAEGGITSEVLTGALLSGAQDVQTQFDGMALTISGAGQQVSNALAEFIGKGDQAVGASAAIAEAISFVARNFGVIANGALAVGLLIGGRLVVQLGASAVAWAANGLQVAAYNASLLRLNATSPLVIAGLRGVTVAAAGLSAALGPIVLIGSAVAAGAFLLARAHSAQAESLTAPIRKLQDYTAQLQAAADSQRALEAGGDPGDIARQARFDEAQKAVAELREEIERTNAEIVALGRDASDSAGLRILALARRSGQLTEALREGEDALREHTDALADNLRWIDASAELRAEAAKSSEDFTKSLQDSITKLRDERTELQQGVRARLVDQALRATGAKTVEQLDDATRELIDTLVAETRATESAKNAQSQAQKARQEAARAAEQAAEALAEFRRQNEDLTAELAGPGAQAQLQYARGLDEAGKLFASGAIGAAELTTRIRLLSEARERDARALADSQDVFGPLLEDLRFEGELIGLNNVEREIAITLRQAEQALMATGTTLTQAELEALREQVAERIRANDAQATAVGVAQQAAEDYERSWSGATDSVLRSFGEFVARGANNFRSLGRQLKDIARSLIADLVAMFLRNQLIFRFGIGGTAVGGPAQALAGGGGGGGGGLGGLQGLSGLAGKLGEGSFKDSLGSIFGENTSGTTLGGIGAAAQSAAIGSMIGGLFGGKGSTGGALGGAIGQAIGGPVGAAIGSVLGGLVGGLFGRKFKTTGTGAEFNIGDDGAGGFAFEDQKKKKLFGGSKRRTVTTALDPEAQRAIDDLFDAVSASVELAARALAIETPALISGSFRAEFDKDGNLVKQFSTIAGRVVNESQEAFAQRLQAVNVLSVIDKALGPLATDLGEAIVQPVIGGFEDVQFEFGDRIGDLIGRSFTGPVAAANQAQGEASRIAERWAGDAEKLLAGAQFLLAASVDLRQGFGLLGEDGTLTDITALVEDLASAGEPLLDTYARLVASTGLLEQALALQNQTLDIGRAEFVRFAADIANAAGGLDRAQALWTDYFNRFFSDNERAAQQLTATEQAAQREAADIGLNASDFATAEGLQEFRALFEQALPTLSADAVVQWLEAANAIGLVIDAQQALNETLGDLDRVAREAAEAMAEDLAAMMETVRDQAIGAADALADFGLSDLAVGMQQVNREVERAIEQAQALGATESDLAEIRELGAARAELLRREAQAELAGLLDDVSNALFELDASPMEIELSRLSRSLANALDEAAALGASEEQLALIRQLSARQSARAIEAEAARQRAEAEQRAAQLSTLLDGVSQSLFELDASPLEIELSRLSRSLANALDEAAALGASEEQLALIRQLSARQSAQAIEAEVDRMRDAFAQLAAAIAGVRGSIADDVLSIRRSQPGFSESAFQAGRIGDLRGQLAGATDPQAQVSLIDQIRQATVARFNAEIAGIERTAQAQQAAAQAAQQAIEAQRQALARLRDFADGLGLSSNSPLTAFQRLDVARSQFDTLAGRARSGDTEAISQLQQAAEALLAENRNVFGVSQTAVAEFDRVQSVLRSVAGQGVRGVATFSGFERASIDASAQIARLQADAIAELQALDDTLAALAITQEAETEGSILALRERFEQAERHKNEIIDRIDPVIASADRAERIEVDQLAEMQRQSAALTQIGAGLDAQGDLSAELIARIDAALAQQSAQIAGLTERLGRAIERSADAKVRA